MTTRQDYTDEEWALLRKALHEPGVAVIMASPGGALREFWAVARGIMEADNRFKDSDFIQSLLREAGTGGAAQPRSDRPTQSEFMSEMITNLRQARKIADSKATIEEAEDFKNLVTSLAERIASAAKEGGEAVTEDEQRILDEIRMALRRKV